MSSGGGSWLHSRTSSCAASVPIPYRPARHAALDVVALCPTQGQVVTRARASRPLVGRGVPGRDCPHEVLHVLRVLLQAEPDTANGQAGGRAPPARQAGAALPRAAAAAPCWRRWQPAPAALHPGACVELHCPARVGGVELCALARVHAVEQQLEADLRVAGDRPACPRRLAAPRRPPPGRPPQLVQRGEPDHSGGEAGVDRWRRGGVHVAARGHGRSRTELPLGLQEPRLDAVQLGP